MKLPDLNARSSARQQYEHLLSVLERLTPQRRAVYQFRKFEGLSLREIGQRLGIAEKTAESPWDWRRHRSMKALFAEGISPSRPTSKRDDEFPRKTSRSKRDRS